MKSVWGLAILPSLLFSISAWAVYGGEPLPAALQGAPHVVRIQTNFNCSAVVLNSFTLMTAGHCTEGLSNGDDILVIHPDTNQKNKNRVQKYFRHHDYREGFADSPKINEIYADIAVIKLASAVSFATAGVDLATSLDVHNLGQLPIWFVANGSTAHQDTSSNSAIPIALTLFSFQILQSQSLQPNAGPCENDSGGGYFVIDAHQVRLIGIQSSKNADVDCGDSNSRGYVVSIPDNLDWLLQDLK